MSNFFKNKMKGKSPGVIAGIVIFGAIAISGLAILFGFIVMWLWNYLMPEIFNLPIITYWQGVGLFILAKLFFGFGGGGDKSSSKADKKSKMKKHMRKNGKESFLGYSCEKDVEKWEYYDAFWKSEGKDAYKNYIAKLNQPNVESRDQGDE